MQRIGTVASGIPEVKVFDSILTVCIICTQRTWIDIDPSTQRNSITANLTRT